MSSEEWYYKVSLIIGTVYDDVQDPEFRFSKGEKGKMQEFMDICLENGHEVKVELTKQEFDK
ncbi:hypothetical protein [Paenibacillus oceani]|uniref:Uncharacterized protein n=1 Tax=Paenibacillus oceani TaxID=2772510 RepID=A0A927C7M0_9BACL|nr:hypothetical protein [Paenibacillus oceani]MBD2861623.1 hypothetical protein [Paenibacillus oceani]